MTKANKLSDLPGIGPAAEEKLMQAGYTTIESIAVASVGEIVGASGIGDGTAAKVIAAARQSLDIGFETADKVYEQRQKMGRITLGAESLNDLLGGGLETQSITEVYGRFGCGKTQWCFQLAVAAQLPKEKGGLGGRVAYVDSENSFRTERITEIANRYDLDPNWVLKNILRGRAYNVDHQMLLVDQIKDIAEKENIKLLIVDSLTAYFRAEFSGRGTLSERQQKLNRHMHSLMKLSETKNMAVLVTNQVMDRPDIMFGDPTTPIGGHVVGHASKTRIYLRKSKGELRVAKLVDSPYLPDAEAIYKITGEGIVDQ
jgi:DNA repair protein RadA